MRINLHLALQSIGAVEGMAPMFGKPLFAFLRDAVDEIRREVAA